LLGSACFACSVLQCVSIQLNKVFYNLFCVEWDGYCYSSVIDQYAFSSIILCLYCAVITSCQKNIEESELVVLFFFHSKFNVFCSIVYGL
jgi:hypothetical protein